MKREKISQAVGEIDIRYIQEAGEYTGMAEHIKPARGTRRRVAAAAAVLVCVAAVGICTPSAANSIKGFFRDIVRWDGAVTGEEYEHASNEVTVDVSMAVMENGKLVLPVEITFLDMDAAPFRIVEEVALGDYQIIDASGKEVFAASGQQGVSGVMRNGKAVCKQPLGMEGLSEGEEYTLAVRSVYGICKAEQPLQLKGHWECRFVIREQ